MFRQARRAAGRVCCSAPGCMDARAGPSRVRAHYAHLDFASLHRRCRCRGYTVLHLWLLAIARMHAGIARVLAWRHRGCGGGLALESMPSQRLCTPLGAMRNILKHATCLMLCIGAAMMHCRFQKELKKRKLTDADFVPSGQWVGWSESRMMETSTIFGSWLLLLHVTFAGGMAKEVGSQQVHQGATTAGSVHTECMYCIVFHAKADKLNRPEGTR